MKINVEFDLNWVDEETIDDAVSRKLVDHAVAEVGEKVITAIKNLADKSLNEKVDTYLEEVLAGFLERNIIITDRWGNITDRYESVNELLETRFDEFITEMVDKNGKTSKERGCRIDGVSRIDYLARKHISNNVSELQSQITKETDAFFKEKIDAAKKSIHKSTVEKYMKTIDFEAAIKK